MTKSDLLLVGALFLAAGLYIQISQAVYYTASLKDSLIITQNSIKLERETLRACEARNLEEYRKQKRKELRK